MRVPFYYFIKNLLRVGSWNYSKSSNFIFPYSLQRYHSLNTLKTLFIRRILVQMKVLNIWIPIALAGSVPPGSPRNYGVKTCNQLLSVPNFTKCLFDFWMSTNQPWSLCMASSIWAKETHVIYSGPILVFPGRWIVSLYFSANIFKPLPKGIFCFFYFFFCKNILEDNASIF